MLHDNVLWEKNGSKNYDDFINRSKLLHSEIRRLVLEDVYPLHFAEEINRLCRLNVVQREKELLSDDEVNLMPLQHRCSYLDAMLSVPFGIMALKENLITPLQISKMKNHEYIQALLSKNGVNALRKGIISPEIVNEIKSPAHCHYVLGENGTIAFKNELISIEQINKFSQARCLKVLFSDKGLMALTKEFLTPDDAAKIRRTGILKNLLKDNGITALKLNLICVEKANEFETIDALNSYLSDLVSKLGEEYSVLKL